MLIGVALVIGGLALALASYPFIGVGGLIVGVIPAFVVYWYRSGRPSPSD